MIKNILKYSLALALLLSASLTAKAQKELTCEEYIATFAPLAMQQQQQYGIPASIKIAQGMLESRYGNSDLSRRSNNHFGIKCKSSWQGDTVRYDDDELQECFRRYRTVEESFSDHSEFLKNRERYADLFKLDPTDYKGWAHGLKAAGYATAPHYANSLIKLIDKYELYLLDDGEMPSYTANVRPVKFPSLVDRAYPVEGIDIDNYTVAVYKIAGYGIYQKSGTPYLLARSGDTYESIARAIGVSERRLRAYNKKRGKNGGYVTAGDAIYLEKEPKRKS